MAASIRDHFQTAWNNGFSNFIDDKKGDVFLKSLPLHELLQLNLSVVSSAVKELQNEVTFPTTPAPDLTKICSLFERINQALDSATSSSSVSPPPAKASLSFALPSFVATASSLEPTPRAVGAFVLPSFATGINMQTSKKSEPVTSPSSEPPPPPRKLEDPICNLPSLVTGLIMADPTAVLTPVVHPPLPNSIPAPPPLPGSMPFCKPFSESPNPPKELLSVDSLFIEVFKEGGDINATSYGSIREVLDPFKIKGTSLDETLRAVVGYFISLFLEKQGVEEMYYAIKASMLIADSDMFLACYQQLKEIRASIDILEQPDTVSKETHETKKS